MKQTDLQKALQEVISFTNPKLTLEQYSTHSHIAADILLMVKESIDLNNSMVLDLGAGTGMLTIGLSLLDCKFYK